MGNGKKSTFYSWFVLFLITPIYFFSNLQKVIIPGAAFDELQQAFALDAAGVTRLGALFLGVYAASQLITGVLADRYGGARIIFAGGLIFCAGSIMSAFDNSLLLLCFSRIITGFGAASIYLCMVKEIGRVAGSALPMILGIATLIGYTGSITGATPFIAGVDRWGYFPMVIGTGTITFLCYLLYVVFAMREKFPPVQKEVKFSIVSYLKVFRNPQNCSLMLSVGISFGIYFALQSTLGKKFLEDFCKLSSEKAGLVLTATMIIAAVNGFIVANISRWTGNRRRPVIVFSGVGCFAGILMILSGVLLNTGSWLPITGMLLMAFAGNVAPIFVAVLKESNEEHRFGTSVCVCNAFAYAISSLACWGAGKLMDIYAPQILNGIKIYSRESYLLVFGALTLLGAVAAVLSCFIRESYGKSIAGEFLTTSRGEK